MAYRALVTAGSAVTMLDDVRSVFLHQTDCGLMQKEASLTSLWHHEMQNIFRGALGVMLAQELVRRGIPTTLLLRKDTIGEVQCQDGLEVKSFKTFEQLQESLNLVLEEENPSLVFMAAAPPDYAPVKLVGKMKSDKEEMTITYRRTPKLLDKIRGKLGESAFIVGFKLLVDVTPEQLHQVAIKQISRAKTSMCVGNDLALIDPIAKTHPMQLVFSDGSRLTLDGKKTEVAAKLIELVLTRSNLQ